MRLSHALIVLSLALPFAAHAEEQTMWDFGVAETASKWTIQDLASQQTEGGLYLRADTDGFIQVPATFTQPFQVVTLTITSPQATQASLIWNLKGTTQFVEFPFAIPAGQFKKVEIVPSALKQWNPHPIGIGFFFKQGTEVMIHDVSVSGWTWPQRLGYAWKSFWRTDEFRPYSINFLWGPLLAQDPVSIAHLYDSLPPLSPSVTRVFYIVLGLALLAVIATWLMRRFRGVDARVLGVFFALAAALWLIFDLRMSVEILSYVRDDVKAYMLPGAGKRTLRTHEDLYDMMFRAMPSLQRAEQYVLVYPDQGQHYGVLRYFSYPALPKTLDKDVTGIPTWLVLDRPDIQVSAENRIVDKDGKPLTLPGKIILPLSSDSFLFSVNP